MFDNQTQDIEWGGRTLTLETGRMARQADGAVLPPTATPLVLAAVTYARQPSPGQDFFPLTVNYQERTYAAGKIPGGLFKA
jgi:polyribonucleotide nucleotidyltransferase